MEVVIVSTILAMVISTVLAGLIWAAVQDGRFEESFRLERERGGGPLALA